MSKCPGGDVAAVSTVINKSSVIKLREYTYVQASTDSIFLPSLPASLSTLLAAYRSFLYSHEPEPTKPSIPLLLVLAYRLFYSHEAEPTKPSTPLLLVLAYHPFFTPTSRNTRSHSSSACPCSTFSAFFSLDDR
ncbi:hypothetical protein E2C01_002486 [Portunus trituberculatus]|uniref:Uncharacterized protein n=1 Tax=Portunus trituberculatus TaxID=210409 RepID=A0A5B7CLB6_PORTR|nr:hypothetical protein [Portunus trituberculatus]